MSTYQAGNATGQVSLTVDISTVGLAASRAITIDLNSSNPGKPVAHSENATGDIYTKEIGQAAALQNLRLSVVTQVDFWGDDAERKSQFDSLGAKYVLDGGTGGEQTYADPEVDVDASYRVAMVSKSIDLI
jgi:hypothetical protein